MFISKKLLPVFLAASMFTGLSNNILASSPIQSSNLPNLQEISISEQNNTVYHIKINPYNRDEIESIIEIYNVMPQTANAIRSYSSKCINGEFSDDSIILETTYNPYTKSSRTYTGYNNKQYLEETINLSNSSESGDVSTGYGVGAYLNSTVNYAVELR